jgi:uncharacterized protein YjbI with pentapeptide repeats
MNWLKCLLVALLVAGCSAPTNLPESVPTTDSSTPMSTTTTQGVESEAVDAGVLWEVKGLDELGLTTNNPLRFLSDLKVVNSRLIAVGRDGGDPLVLLSDDQGLTWQEAAVEKPSGAEVASVAALAHHDGVLVAVGFIGYDCSDPNSLCYDFLGGVWRSTDAGLSWTLVDAPTLAPGPESTITDVTVGPDGFVAVGRVYGPAPNSGLVWTSVDGLQWSEGIALPSSSGGFTWGSQLVSGSGTVAITGEEVLCGGWFDNGFWVVIAGFVRQARLWTLDGPVVSPVDLEAAGVSQPPVSVCPSEGILEDWERYWSEFGEVGLLGGQPAVALPGRGFAVIGPTGELRVETFAPLADEGLYIVDGSEAVIGVHAGSRGLMETRSWIGDSGWTLQPAGLPIPSGGSVSLSAVVALGDAMIGVGRIAAGVTEGVIWRSVPGMVFEGQGLTCQPGPAADCRGVDLSRQDLSNLDLAGIDLRHADLSGADLSGSDLSAAKFGSADLWGVNLADAVLRDSDLAGVRISSLGLDEADLSGADFTGADLRGATLELKAPAIFDEIVADAAYFNVTGTVVGASFRNARLERAFVTRAYDADEAKLVANFDGADLSLAYIDVDTTGSTFAGIAGSEVNLGADAVCPDGQLPISEAYGISRCTLDS